MQAVEFQTRVENGVITIPDEYKQELTDGAVVKVTVAKQPTKKISETGILAELARNPVRVAGIRSITRDEMHER
jgi:hypothetical protein